MNLPLIDGLEALPVRMIPFVTNGDVGPHSTALLLAEKITIGAMRALNKKDMLEAHRLLKDGTIYDMGKNEWKTPLFEIESLTERFDRRNKHSKEWLNVAIGLLIPAFVWKKEFITIYENSFSGISADSKFSELNWTPYISADQEKLAFECYEEFLLPPLDELPKQNAEQKSCKDIQLSPDTAPPKVDKKPPGRSIGPLRKVVEHVYAKCLDEGKLDIIKRGNVTKFILMIRTLSKEGPNSSSYVEERIDKVSFIKGKYEITTNERLTNVTKSSELKWKSKTYYAKDVSKLITNIRNPKKKTDKS